VKWICDPGGTWEAKRSYSLDIQQPPSSIGMLKE